MKPKQYIKKYNLDKGGVDKFSHSEFVADLTFDFITLLEVGRATENIKGFENAVRAIRMKWDGIHNKTLGQLPDKLWNYFFATVIAKTREELFPEIMERRKKEADQRQQWREDRKSEKERWGDFFSWGFLFNAMKGQTKPVESFQTLGLPTEATEDDVKKAYRSLSLKHHPDKGGNEAKFIEITEAKNRCISYLT